jgi:carbonic anhydrase
MKHKILIYTLLSLVACALNVQNVTGKKVIWDYPVKPGMEEWGKFGSNEELPKKDKNTALSSGMTEEQPVNVIDNLSYQLIKQTIQ